MSIAMAKKSGKRPRVTFDCSWELATALQLILVKAEVNTTGELVAPILERELRKRYPECFEDAKRYAPKGSVE